MRTIKISHCIIMSFGESVHNTVDFKKNFTSRFALTFLLRNRCRSSLDMFQVRVARRSGAFFVFKRCQRPVGGRGDYHRHRFQNTNFAQITVRSRSCGYRRHELSALHDKISNHDFWICLFMFTLFKLTCIH